MVRPELIDVPTEIQTTRLTLRQTAPGDGAAVLAAVKASEKELRAWMPWVDKSLTLEDCEQEARRAQARFIKREELRYHVFLRESGALIGSSGYPRMDWNVPKFEIGYWIDSRYTGKGYATELTETLTNLAFETLNAKRVEIRCDPLNLASAAIPQKLGFDLEGILRNNVLACDGSGEPCSTMVFAKVRP